MSVTPCTFKGEIGVAYILEPFGNYINLGKPTGKYHSGIDLAARPEDKVYAIEPGMIEDIRVGTNQYTSYVLLRGEKTGYKFYYKHTATNFTKCDIVCEGQELGWLVADKVFWAGWHLHFEIADNRDKRYDPVEYLIDNQPELLYRFGIRKRTESYYKNHTELYDKMKKA